MSIYEDDVLTVPWVGAKSHKNCLYVVVLSSNVHIIEKISNALSDVHAKGNYRWKLITLRSLHLGKIIEISGKIGIDFIILAMDTSRLTCLDWTKKELGQIHPDLRTRRTVLVNASGLPANGMAVNASDLISFQSDNKLDMLTANVFTPSEVGNLAQRLLKYMEVFVGIHTGIPNLSL